jgi:putative transposase
VCLRFVFLHAVQIPAWLRLSRRPPTWKDAEILLLRHQLAVLQRQTAARPKLRWTDRALFAALLTLIPRSCHGALHLFITPGTILCSQAEAILALDLFTVDLLDGTKAYVLAAIEHATRRIRILGATAHPGGQWIVQQARNLCMDLDQASGNVKFVVHDRDATFHEGFDAVFTAAGLRIVRSGVRMPRMNSIMERWIGGCRRELLDRTLIWNLPHLRRILAACERHHNDHRPHMALSSAAPLKPLPAEIADLEAFRVRRRDRSGGVIHEYQHAA